MTTKRCWTAIETHKITSNGRNDQNVKQNGYKIVTEAFLTLSQTTSEGMVYGLQVEQKVKGPRPVFSLRSRWA